MSKPRPDIVQRLLDWAYTICTFEKAQVARDAAAEINRLRAELAAAIKQRDEARGQTWYLLYGGTSEDGAGIGHYIGRTTDKEVARKHHAKVRKSPYSIGFVEIVTDTEKKQVSYYGRELETKKEGGGA